MGCACFDECFPLHNKGQYTFQVMNHIDRIVNKDKIQISFSSLFILLKERKKCMRDNEWIMLSSQSFFKK